MSTNISAAFDAIEDRAQAVLSGHFELPNAEPSRIGLNSEQNLIKGYAIDFGAGQRSARDIGDIIGMKRTITFTITRQWFAKDADRQGKIDAKKLLLEDQIAIIKDFEGDPTLRNSDVVASFKYVSDPGIKAIYPDRADFLMLQSTFLLEYFERTS